MKRAVAVKKSSRERTKGFQEMGTLRRDGCGEEFVIGHNPQSVDKRVSEEQARWLEKSWPKRTSATGRREALRPNRTARLRAGALLHVYVGMLRLSFNWHPNWHSEPNPLRIALGANRHANFPVVRPRRTWSCAVPQKNRKSCRLQVLPQRLAESRNATIVS